MKNKIQLASISEIRVNASAGADRTVPAGAVPLMTWCSREARRLGVATMTVHARIRNGFYRGMKLFQQNSRRVFVVKPGKSRSAITARARALASRRGRALRHAPAKPLHERDVAQPSFGKYAGWMSTFEAGRMTPRHGG